MILEKSTGKNYKSNGENYKIMGENGWSQNQHHA